MAQKDNFTTHPAKFLSLFVERMVPDYVREDHPMFITFLRKYFEYLERETDANGELGEYRQITDLIQNLDVDHALDSFIPEFEKQYLHGTPHTAVDPTISTTDKAFLTKNIQPIYRQKGTTNALNFLFRRDFDSSVETIYPKQWMWRASGSVWYEPEWITILTDKETEDSNSPYYGETENVVVPETVKTLYNKKIVGQTSGATAFVDMPEDVTVSTYEKLLLTEVSGVFLKDEEVWEDIGTQLNVVPFKARIISEGIRTEGECIINGHTWQDKWMHVTGHPNEVPVIFEKPLITGLTSGATAEIKGLDVDFTKMNLLNVNLDFQEGEYIVNTLAYQYDSSYPGNAPVQSFCTVSPDWPADPQTGYSTFDNMIDCQAALHPEGNESASPYFGEPAFLEWYPVLELTTGIQTVENSILQNITEPPETREACDALLDTVAQPNVKTAVWKTNGYWLDSAGFLSSDRKMQDNDYYQDFSYVVKSSVPVQAYREVLKKLVHPVGLKLFAEFSYDSNVDLVVEMPTDYVKWFITIFSYLDVAMDIWDAESEQHGTLGHAHTGFELFLETGFDEYVVEVLKNLEARSGLVGAEDWDNPSDHFSVNWQIDGGRIGSRIQEKLYTISWINDEVKIGLAAIPHTTVLDFTQHLLVLPIKEFPPSVQEMEIYDSRGNEADGRMISCSVWELTVQKALQRFISWLEAFIPEAEYAPEKSYGHFETYREDTIVHKVYGMTNDVIDSVQVGTFENAAHIIHNHGRKNGFAPVVDTKLTKGQTAPDLSVGAAAFHVHEFEDPVCSDTQYTDKASCETAGETWGYVEIKNLIVHGKTATTAPMTVQQARDLVNRDAFEIPKFFADKHTTAFFPEATNHVHFFEEGEIVDRQRGRVANCLRREEARDLIDGTIASVTLYDNIGKLQDSQDPIEDAQGVHQGGTIENGTGGVMTAHYHEYTVTYDSNWENGTDFQGNPLTHGFVYTPVATWVCFNFHPELGVGGNNLWVDELQTYWEQNVFAVVDDATMQTLLSEPSFTFHHPQTWSPTLNPNVDWVELYSSNFIQSVPGSGDTGDLVGSALITDQVTDIATIVAYPMDPDVVAIVDQSGIINLLDTTTGVVSLFFSLTNLNLTIGLGPFGAYDERGCLGLAWHPDYANNGKFYVYYMTEQGPAVGAYGYPLSTTIISEFTANVATNAVDPASERILLTIPQPDMNHNGGQLAFGPDDMLYIGLGDGGSAGDTSSSSGHGGHGLYGNAQNPSNLLGTILRIDPAEDTVNGIPYTIPADNPFKETPRLYGDSGLVYFKEEIWAYGLRNPWRFSFDTQGRLWCADVGQNMWEEINIIEKGGNYGWRVIEGYHNYEQDQAIIDQIALDLQYANTNEFLNDLKHPIHEYSHGIGISIVSGFVYRGTALDGMLGKYIFGDWSKTWSGTSGHIYSLEENPEGLTAYFDITPNAVNGANHSHTCELSPAQVASLQANPGSTVFVVQSDNVHAESYTHTFEIMWNSQFNQWNLVSQTNLENHDVFTFREYSDTPGWTRKALSFWDPVSEIVTLTTHDRSLLTIGEDTNGEIYLSTRVGIDSYQGTGPNNTSIYKLTETFDSSTETPAQSQIPAGEMAHVHGYRIEYDDAAETFTAQEISDIEMTVWDAFYPVWTYNDPVSHLHPVTVSWIPSFDEEIQIGSSGGWHYNTNKVPPVWEPYDIGADTPWQAQVDEEDVTTYIETAPIVEILGANEYGQTSHIHYFDGSELDTFGPNSDRLAMPITRIEAEQLANGIVAEKIVFCSIANSGLHDHYHKYSITYNTATKQFQADEIEELWDTQGTGQWTPVDEINKTHEHPIAVNGIMTHLGWNGQPLYNAPDITLSHAHDWDELQGSEADHLHSFNGTYLDTIGANAGRQSLALDDNQTTDLINGDIDSVKLYTSIATGDHYHAITVTYDENNLAFIATDVEKWSSADGLQFYLEDPRTHAHPTNVQGLASQPGFNEMMTDMPVFSSPGYPYPGGSHPHFHNNSIVGPFAWNNQIDYAHGLNVTEAMQLIDGIVSSVKIYDSIEGAHFHEYTIMWNDSTDKFYVDNSITWIRGGIEDASQDPTKYYVSVVENPSEGLHWHNLVIDWNPLDTDPPHMEGGAIYITKIEPVDEVLTSQPNVVTEVTSTALNPVTTSYPDTPNPGDTTIIIQYQDLVTTTVTTTTQITTTTTTTTYYSDYGTSVVVGSPVTTYDVQTSVSTQTVEDMDERKTYVNTVLQANNPPILTMQPSFIEGEGSHDHLLYEDCELDTAGPYAGRMCEPITLAQANELINEQNANYGIIFYDSPNGADNHYHAYTIKFNPFAGTDGEFEVDGIGQYDQIYGSGTTIHTFKLTGGYHDHDYWMTVADYTSLLTGTHIVTPQRDSTHASSYTHELTLSWNGSTYNIENQTSDYDNHDTISYTGAVAQGGQWVQNTDGGGVGDHVHSVTIDDSDVWPVDPD